MSLIIKGCVVNMCFMYVCPYFRVLWCSMFGPIYGNDMTQTPKRLKGSVFYRSFIPLVDYIQLHFDVTHTHTTHILQQIYM